MVRVKILICLAEGNSDSPKAERSSKYDWKAEKNSRKKPSFNSSVDLTNVVLQEWQKDALKRASQQTRKTESYRKDRTAHPTTTVPAITASPSPIKRFKTADEVKQETEEKQKSLKNTMRFFDTNEISSDEEEEED